MIVSALMVPTSIILFGEFISLMIDRTVPIDVLTPTMLLPLYGGGQEV